MMKIIKSGLLVILLCLSPLALALDLDQARAQGRVGETLSGYIAAVQSDAETRALVARINDGRAREYQRVAEQNNLTADEVAAIAGQKLVSRAKTGEYVRGISGQWLKK